MKKDLPEAYSVYLGDTHYKIKVSKEGYEQIKAIAKATAVCQQCRHYYSEQNPNVAGLLCLRCFQTSHMNLALTFHGLLDPGTNVKRQSFNLAPYENPVYLFLDPQGDTYTTEAGPGKDTEAKHDSALTLKYWDFPRPEQAQLGGELVDASGYSWSIYGDVRNGEALIIQHGHKCYKNEILFVVQRKGQALQLSRRRPMHRAILASAREELEATRTPEGYLIDGKSVPWIDDGDIYRRAAQLIGEELKARRATAEQPPLLEEAQPA